MATRPPPDTQNLEAEVADVFDLGGAVSPPPPAEPGVAPAKPGEGGDVDAPSDPPSPVPPPPPAAAPAPPPPPGLDAPAAASGTPAPPPPPAAPAAPNEAEMRASSLEAQLQAAQAELARMRETPAAPAKPGSPSAPGGDQPEEVRYALSIPDQLSQAILGEDPVQAQQGMTVLVNSLAQHIHTRVIGDVERRLTAMESQRLQERTSTEQGAAIEQAREQYFTAYPQHRDPILGPLISSTAAQLSVEFPNHPWNEQYMAALGTRVEAALTKLRGGQQPAPAPSPPPPPSPRPPAMLPAGAPRGGEPFNFNEGGGTDQTDLVWGPG